MNKTKPFFLICCLSLFIPGCSEKPPIDKKTHLLNTLASMETAIEAKSLDDFFEYVSEDFKSAQRGWNKKDAERLLRLRLMRQKSVHIHQAIKRIDWLDDGVEQAEVEVVVAMAGTDFSLTELPSFRGDMVKFIVTFRLIEDEYLVTQTEWNRANPTDFVF